MFSAIKEVPQEIIGSNKRSDLTKLNQTPPCNSYLSLLRVAYRAYRSIFGPQALNE